MPFINDLHRKLSDLAFRLQRKVEDKIERGKERLPPDITAVPCPFCKSSSLIVDRDTRPTNVYISCDDCGAQGPDADTLEEALRK